MSRAGSTPALDNGDAKPFARASGVTISSILVIGSAARFLRVSREGVSLPYIRKAAPACMNLRRFVLTRCVSATAMLLCATLANSPAWAQTGYTWEQVKAKFEAANPALRADAIGIDEA